MDTDVDRLLIVDDQQEIIDLLVRQLGKSFDCVCATSGAEALQKLSTEGPFAAVLSDFSMPGMDGITLLGEIANQAPDSVRMILTAYDDIDIAVTALHQGRIFRFLRKPWDPDELRQSVSDAVDQYLLVQSRRRLTRQLADTNAELDKKVAELDELNHQLEYWVEFSPAVLYSARVRDEGDVSLAYVSKNFARLTGHERTKLIVNPDFWYENIHEEDRKRVNDCLNDALHDQDTRATSVRYRAANTGGSYTDVLDSFRILRASNGQPLELVGSWVDVSSVR